MRSFTRPETLDPVPGDVVNALRTIDRAAGAEAWYRDQVPQLLEALRREARVESVRASSAIEGVLVDEARVPRLVSGKAGRFRTRSEAEFAGYTAALDYLYHAEPGELTVGLVLHLHRLLFSATGGRGGHFKTEDNLVVDRRPGGTRRVRFQPVGWRETPYFTEELVMRTRGALGSGGHHPLVVAAAFILDLLCIHPFGDGNGRVARLLTTYLLERNGYGVGRYVSVEQLVLDTRDAYYDALSRSTEGWFDDGRHDLWPWAAYLFGRLEVAYGRFASKIAAGTSGGTKQDRVSDYALLQAPDTFSIADIRRAVPGVSDNTIRLVLARLRDEGRIAADGVGRGARWRRV